MTSKWLLGACAAALVAGAGAQAQAAGKDGKVWAAAEAARPAQLDLLKQVVTLDSSTCNV